MTTSVLRAGAAFALLVSLFALPATASAAVKTRAALVRDAAGVRIEVKVTVTLSNGQAGDDIVAFSNVDSSHVWVGPQLVQYEHNPQIMQNC
jgi:hypothetical protein